GEGRLHSTNRLIRANIADREEDQMTSSALPEPDSDPADAPKLGPISHTPSKPVRTELAREVGYVCPAPDCASPLLTWHHFDPPFSERPHHEAAGMIALCEKHHRFADNGAYTREQLREMKKTGR